MERSLHERWDVLCARVGVFAGAEEADLTGEMLSTLYSHPPRVYHTLDHVRDCLSVFDTVRLLAEDRDACEFAIWLHDGVYFAERSDNEARSAEAAQMIAGLLGCRAEFVNTVRTLIMATRHSTSPPTADAALVADIDLSVLGGTWEVYDAYRRAIRAEYAWADDEAFRGGRLAFLDRMLDRPTIYTTAWFQEEYEERARDNLERERTELEIQPF